MEHPFFPYLCLGLFAAAKNDFNYPYQPGHNEGESILLYALSGLAAEMLKHGQVYTYTLPEIFALFEKPIGQWWPGGEENLPDGIEPYVTLLDRGPCLDYVEEYLDLYEMPKAFTLPAIRELEAEKDIQALVNLCRGSEALAGEYVIVRRFMIEHPYIISSEFFDVLGDLKIYTDLARMNFYETIDVFDQYANHDGKYWLCPYCEGILNWRGHTPYCARHSVCGKLTHDYRGRKPLTPDQNLRRLKWSLHTRVCTPGKPELALYHWLTEDEAGPHFSREQVELWPGADAYDLRISCNGRIWAVDVKDYTNPTALGHKLKQKPFPHFGHSDTLRWDEAFYVYPDYRVKADRDYHEKLRRAMGESQARVQSMRRFKQNILKILT